ncbi:hypothetical protein E3202_02505 [Oecophyllibacter saccharovorans]|uniref:Uncharacterized protein n=1 Tax=Oecophyllibacter saccharovorans TaxID=2558360 RepID=A0A506UR58_9PROT|nr:hypothetical protein E3202_02505 [Oecophyllibacter saccharovorans]
MPLNYKLPEEYCLTFCHETENMYEHSQNKVIPDEFIPKTLKPFSAHFSQSGPKKIHLEGNFSVFFRFFW